jgi:cell division protease FtsH
MQLPKTDRYTRTKKQLIGEITGLMAGIVAEEIIFNDISTGASNDIQLSTRLARLMVCEWGMSKKLGPIRYANTEQAVSCVNDETYVKLAYSETISKDIDEEVKKIIETSYNTAHQLLEQNKKIFFAIAEELLSCEALDIHDINNIIAKFT